MAIFNRLCQMINVGITEPGTSIKSWAYQLQNADPEEIATSNFDIIVIDYSRDGTDSGMYNPEEIEMIKESGKIVLAYLSIGEAEDYRFYWNDSWRENPPEWLGKENPEWPGNYPVRYWYEEWHEIIIRYVDKIISQGFNGLYLDRIDVFEYWSNPDNGENFTISVEEAAKLMIDFVLKIAYYCRVERGINDFLIVPQNGENILEYDNGSYLDAISGIGIEDLWYEGLKPKDPEEISCRMHYIDIIKEAGKIVLSVEYVDDGSGYVGENKQRIDDYYSKARSKGYIPYAALCDRKLDELNIIDGIQPPETENLEEKTVGLLIVLIIMSLISLAYKVIRSKSKS